jgi:hypothetical protein
MRKRFMLIAATLLLLPVFSASHRAAPNSALLRSSITKEHRNPECAEGWNEAPLPCHCSGTNSRSGIQSTPGDIQMPGFCLH